MGLINSNGTRQRLHSTIPRPGATAARVKRLADSGDPEVFATLRVARELVPSGQAVKTRWIHGLATGPTRLTRPHRLGRGIIRTDVREQGPGRGTIATSGPGEVGLRPGRTPDRDRPETLPE